MLRVTQVRLPVGHAPEEIPAKTASRLGIPVSAIRTWAVERRAVDARKKQRLCYVYTVLVSAEKEGRILKKKASSGIEFYQPVEYRFPFESPDGLSQRPVIIGSGPAGLFCARMLSVHGFRPILLERGDDVETRRLKVSGFWNGGPLDTESNVQFGEGGAGTFSDGKLYTGVHDQLGRIKKVLEMFVESGAPEEILYDAHAHLGTDQLSGIVKHLREQITAEGGDVFFRSKVTSLILRDGAVAGVRTEDGRQFDTSVVIAAVGHSARDTFRMFMDSRVPMEPKPFAVGIRIQHDQQLITRAQYGTDAPEELGAAPYRLHTQTAGNRAVYSFCMCPGGYILNASSENGRLVVNGMSDQARNSGYANSAIVAAVRPEECARLTRGSGNSLFAAMRFQEQLEEDAYKAAHGAIPVQSFGNFCTGSHKEEPGRIFCAKGRWDYADVRHILPDTLAAAVEEGIGKFEQVITGYSDPGVLLAGIESRTSSPVRILRGDTMESPLRGFFPCGEGAGYAGGITSAAVDGLRCAEAAAKRLCGG